MTPQPIWGQLVYLQRHPSPNHCHHGLDTLGLVHQVGGVTSVLTLWNSQQPDLETQGGHGRWTPVGWEVGITCVAMDTRGARWGPQVRPGPHSLSGDNWSTRRVPPWWPPWTHRAQATPPTWRKKKDKSRMTCGPKSIFPKTHNYFSHITNAYCCKILLALDLLCELNSWGDLTSIEGYLGLKWPQTEWKLFFYNSREPKSEIQL
jgi:hypothetical protein